MNSGSPLAKFCIQFEEDGVAAKGVDGNESNSVADIAGKRADAAVAGAPGLCRGGDMGA